MTAINFSGPVPQHALTARSWTDEASRQAGFVSWVTMEGSARTVANIGGTDRISAVAARAGSLSLAADSGGSGPAVSTASGMEAAKFTTGQNCGLIGPQTVDRDNFALVLIADFGTAPPAQNRTLMGVAGPTDYLRLWRNPSLGWSWRHGSTDAATLTFAWAPGPTMLIAERHAGNAMSLRIRNRTATSAVATGTLDPGAIPAAVRLVLGQDRYTEGAAVPGISQAWNEHIHEAALYHGAVLGSPDRLAFWDAYFTAVYGG